MLDIARGNLRRWKETAERSRPYLAEWERLLAEPLPVLLEALTADTAQMSSLRQSTPFCGILKPRERWEIYEAFSS